MSLNKSSMSPTDVVSDFEYALAKLKLLLTKDHELEAKQLEWEANKGRGGGCGGGSTDTTTDQSMIQLEIKLKGALSRFEEALSVFEAAQTQLAEAMIQLEGAGTSLEGGMNYSKLEDVKVSINVSKNRVEAAITELKEAESKFIDVKTQLEIATSTIITKGSGASACEQENNDLRIQICELKKAELQRRICELERSELKLKEEAKACEANIGRLEEKSRAEIEKVTKENKSLKDEVSELRRGNGDLEKCGAENKRIVAENLELKNAKEKTESELEKIGIQLQQVKKENKSLQDGLKETFKMVKPGNPVVYFDIEIRGVPTGKIVMELYMHSVPRLAEIFRKLCTGEMILPGTDGVLGYKGTSIRYFYVANQMIGGNVKVKNFDEFHSIYGQFSSAERPSTNLKTHGDLFLMVGYTDQRQSHTFAIKGSGSVGQYNERYPLIGRVIQGMDVVDGKNSGVVEGYQSDEAILIAECGQLF